jgi:hypothetical protein
MVGYVIGLGDRHPGNILIEQIKFNAISIDFGDVFEAAAERTNFPEHVPFRLTPEIFNAFEVGPTCQPTCLPPQNQLTISPSHSLQLCTVSKLQVPAATSNAHPRSPWGSYVNTKRRSWRCWKPLRWTLY